MAISQSKYIRISTDAGSATLGSRDLSGLVFTATSMLATAPANIKSEYDANGSTIGLSLNDVSKCFGNSSDEYKFAVKYFGYVNKNGSSPSVLNFCKVEEDEAPSAAIARVDQSTNNFGSFTFLSSSAREFSDVELKGASGVNSGYDHKYLFCVAYEYEDTSDAVDKMQNYGDAVGTFVYFGSDAYGAAIPMAITASIRWSLRDSTVCFMFKQIAGETPVITNDSDYEAMKTIDANFYGQTQTNGKSFSFLQCGFNSNGEDAGVYINELWLKSAIATDYMNLVTSVNKIPANEDGAAMIRAAIFGNIQTALRNGMILTNKNITEQDRAEIYRYTGDEYAASDVATLGYWLGVVVGKEGSEYKAYYYLVYSKGDAIRFVEGNHKLV